MDLDPPPRGGRTDGPASRPSRPADGDGEGPSGVDRTTIVRWSVLASSGASPTDTLKPELRDEALAGAGRLRPRPVALSSPGSPAEGADFELLDHLGRGGMGIVHAARQASLDRVVALKELVATSPDSAARDAFLAEAAVIGDLDHPGIVPIHDLGVTARGKLFYTMKRIQGQPWNRVLGTRPLDEELETLLRVCDAVAFAHSRGVLHRDLKPHNVMLGDFGEVLVVDWGLAVGIAGQGRAQRLTEDSAIGGTAAYMAPEMALGDTAAITFASDVYLLGAILFEIVTGRPPHAGANLLATLAAAAANRIVATGHEGELMEIARRALSTDPRDRHGSVKELQESIRAYLAHAQSLFLAGQARSSLGRADEGSDYGLFGRAIAGFEQALALWDGNRLAAEGLVAARTAYARVAMAREDLDLAASQLAGSGPGLEALRAEVERARGRRDQRQRRIRLLSLTARGLTLALVLSLAAGLAAVVRGRNRVQRAERLAAAQRDVALGTLDTLVFSVDRELRDRPAMDGMRRQLLDQAIAGLERVIASAGDSSAADRKLATAHQSLAGVFHAARRNREAVAHQRAALGILARLHGVPKGELAAARKAMGDILHNYRLGDLAAAREEYRQAGALLGAPPAGVTADRELRQRVELSLALGDVALDMGDVPAAALEYDGAWQLLRRAGGRPGLGRLPVTVLLRRGDLAWEQDQLDACADLYRQALERSEELASGGEAGLEPRRDAGLAAFSLAGTEAARGRLREARDLFGRARAAFEALVASDSTNGQFQRDLLTVLFGLGSLELKDGRTDRALGLFEEATAVARRLLALNPQNAEARRDLFVCHNRVGDAHLARGRVARAREAYERSLELSSALAAASPGNVGARTDEIVSLFKLGEAARAAGDCARASGFWRRARGILVTLAAQGRIEPGSSRTATWTAELDEKLASCGAGVRPSAPPPRPPGPPPR